MARKRKVTHRQVEFVQAWKGYESGQSVTVEDSVAKAWVAAGVAKMIVQRRNKAAKAPKRKMVSQ